jgi:hypothetical protein
VLCWWIVNTGSIKDTAGNAIQLATPAVASSANTITVDAKAPNAVDLNSATDVQSTSKALNVMSVSSISLSLVALKPTPPNTTLIELIQRGFVINGESTGDFSGISVSSAGDVNGDGLDDLIVGAYANDQSNKSLAGRSAPLVMKQLLRLIHYLQYLYK